MTIEEMLARAEIQHLVSSWAILVDKREVPAWVWTEDAVVLSPGGVRIEGRDNIVSRFRGETYTYTTRTSNVPATSNQPAIPGPTSATSGLPRRTLHNLTSMLIEFLNADSATGLIYYVGYNEDGPSSSGRYFDKYSRIAGRWFISERKTRLEYLPPDPFWDAGRALIADDWEAEERGAKW